MSLKTHSAVGPLPRKVHFPFPIQPHGLSSATVFSLRQRQPPAAVWAPTLPPSAHSDPAVLDSHHPSDPPQNRLPTQETRYYIFLFFIHNHPTPKLSHVSGLDCQVSRYKYTLRVMVRCSFLSAIDLLTFELCCHMIHLLSGF